MENAEVEASLLSFSEGYLDNCVVDPASLAGVEGVDGKGVVRVDSEAARRLRKRRNEED
jgi:hypothetical protein